MTQLKLNICRCQFTPDRRYCSRCIRLINSMHGKK